MQGFQRALLELMSDLKGRGSEEGRGPQGLSCTPLPFPSFPTCQDAKGSSHMCRQPSGTQAASRPDLGCSCPARWHQSLEGFLPPHLSLPKLLPLGRVRLISQRHVPWERRVICQPLCFSPGSSQLVEMELVGEI